MSGILSGPIDQDGPGGRQPRRPEWPTQEATVGLTVRHRTTGTVGEVVTFSPQQVVLRDGRGREHVLPVAHGAFSVAGRTVNLVRPKPVDDGAPSFTPSGSVTPAATGARVAVPSRLMVEGLHDAELVEKIWGDDLRVEGVVVEPLHGADDLVAVIDSFDPGPDRRLGILLDHLVDNTKESQLAWTARRPHVMIRGHRFVDIWQAVHPGVIGIEGWPSVPMGQDWKTGIIEALGFDGTTGDFWRLLLSRASDYRHLDPSLVGAVEELIDFVAPPPEYDS